jgi:tRNA(His) 5'-end guanylyltransferase
MFTRALFIYKPTARNHSQKKTKRDRMKRHVSQASMLRNHNNAYVYWIFRKMGYKLAEIVKKLKRLKTKEFHEMMFKHGVNLAKTLEW